MIRTFFGHFGISGILLKSLRSMPNKAIKNNKETEALHIEKICSLNFPEITNLCTVRTYSIASICLRGVLRA